eukprot:3294047-Pyramimonas_sp.AAC.1
MLQTYLAFASKRLAFTFFRSPPAHCLTFGEQQAHSDKYESRGLPAIKQLAWKQHMRDGPNQFGVARHTASKGQTNAQYKYDGVRYFASKCENAGNIAGKSDGDDTAQCADKISSRHECGSIYPGSHHTLLGVWHEAVEETRHTECGNAVEKPSSAC